MADAPPPPTELKRELTMIEPQHLHLDLTKGSLMSYILRALSVLDADRFAATMEGMKTGVFKQAEVNFIPGSFTLRCGWDKRQELNSLEGDDVKDALLLDEFLQDKFSENELLDTFLVMADECVSSSERELVRADLFWEGMWTAYACIHVMNTLAITSVSTTYLSLLSNLEAGVAWIFDVPTSYFNGLTVKFVREVGPENDLSPFVILLLNVYDSKDMMTEGCPKLHSDARQTMCDFAGTPVNERITPARLGTVAPADSSPTEESKVDAVVAPESLVEESADETVQVNKDWETVAMKELQANLDDMTPEHLAYCCQLLLEQGAADVWTTSIVMKKGRAARTLHVLCAESQVDSLLPLVFEHSTSLGVRIYALNRVAVPRKIITVATQWGDIPVKVGDLGGTVVSVKPEFDVIAANATEAKVSIQTISREATQKAYEQL